MIKTLESAAANSSDGLRVLRLRDSPSPAHVLLIEVEPMLADSIKYTLERDGYRVVAPETRQAALTAMQVESPGLILMDMVRLSSDVIDLCRNLRAASSASIIVMTPSTSDADRVDLMAAGVDDVLTKPFSLRELSHRVGARVRGKASVSAAHESHDEMLRVGPVEMDVANHEVRVRGKLTVFPPKEFALLELFLRSRGRLQTRARLIAAVWGPDYYGDGKTLDTHVKRLREKIESDRRLPRHLIVVRGLGYRFVEQKDSD